MAGFDKNAWCQAWYVFSIPSSNVTDGQTEKVNGVIGTYLRAFARHQPDDWDLVLPLGEFAYNSSQHSSTHQTPFALDLGYTPKIPMDLAIACTINQTTDHAVSRRRGSGDALTFVEQMASNLDLAREKLKEAQDAQKVEADKSRQEVPFQVGQQVYLNTQNLPLTYSNASDQRSRKLQDLFDGPFTITKASQSPNAWYLDLPTQWTIKQPLNVSLFKRDLSDPTRPRLPPPVNNSMYGAEYLVEAIVGHEDRKATGKGSNNERYYKWRWTG